MNDQANVKLPADYQEISQESRSISFLMPSDIYTGNLLRCLAGSKPKSRLLELATGTGIYVGFEHSWRILRRGGMIVLNDVQPQPNCKKVLSVMVIKFLAVASDPSGHWGIQCPAPSR